MFYNKNLGGIADGDLGVYTGERFKKECSTINLVSAVHVETVVGQKPGGFEIDTVAETKYVVEQSKALAPIPIGIVAYVHLARADYKSILNGHLEAVAGAPNNAILGVRQIMNFRADGQLTWPQVEHGDYFDGKSSASLAFAAALADIAARDLSFDLHCNWFQLEEAAHFLQAHAPAGLRVVLDHVGCLKTGPEVGSDSDESRVAVWEAGIAALSSLPNAYIKLSGLEYVYPGWMDKSSEANKKAAALVRSILKHFGAGRVMFASNYPVDKFMATGAPPIEQLVEATWNLLEELHVTAEETAAIFAGTAHRAYKLEKILAKAA